MERVEAEGIRVVTIGAWLDRLDRRAGNDHAAGLIVEEAARAALAAVRRGLRPGEDEELVSDVLVLALDPPMSWRQPSLAVTPLAAWFAGVMKNLLPALRRGALPGAGDDLHDLESADGRGSIGRRARPGRSAPTVRPDTEDGADTDTKPTDVDPAAHLTRRQFAAWELVVRRRMPERDAAKALRCSRWALRDRLARAKGRIARGHSAPRAGSPEDAARLAVEAARRGDENTAALLRLRGLGRTYRECAALLGRTVEAVASRLKRFWIGLVVAPAPRRTDVPPGSPPRPRAIDQPTSALPCEEGASPLPEGGFPD